MYLLSDNLAITFIITQYTEALVVAARTSCFLQQSYFNLRDVISLSLFTTTVVHTDQPQQ